MGQQLLLRLHDVLVLTSLKRSSLYKAIQEGKFPPPKKLSDKSVAWKVSDIEEWANALPVASHYATSDGELS